MKKQPNILFIMPDAVRRDALARDSICRKPNFDSIAEKGVTFSRAYTPTAVCSPARASLMTGLLAHNHGVLQVEHCVDDDQSVLRTDKPHWAQRLEQAGYQTGYCGKWHIERSNKLEDFGWQVNQCSNKNAIHKAGELETKNLDKTIIRYQEGNEGYKPILHYGITDMPVEERPVGLIVKLAEEYLEKALKNNKPWCCFVTFCEPNEELICSRDTFNQYKVDDIELPSNINDDLSGRPAIYKRTQELWKDITPRQWKEAMACYYSRITEIDQQIGKLIKQVKAAGQMENTIVVVTADHGRYLGSHGMEAHQFGAFEEIYNVPLIIAGPGIAGNTRTTARVGVHDIGPTLLELAGAEPINTTDSRSFADVLRKPEENEKKFNTGYAEYHGTRFPLMQRIFWEDQWKLVFNGFDYDELYNLKEDPLEMKNLVNEPAHKDRYHSMMKKLWGRIIKTNDKSLINAHYYSLRFACVGQGAADKKDI